MNFHGLSFPELDHTVTIEVPALLEAGGVYNISCIVTTDIRPHVKWMGPDGKDISAEDIGSGTGIAQATATDSNITTGSPVIMGNQTILSLSFSPLRTSHGGRYTCMSVVESPTSVKTATKDVIVTSKYLVNSQAEIPYTHPRNPQKSM